MVRNDSRNQKWVSNKGAREQVLQLLEESGALLEAHVSEVCQQFANDNHKKQGARGWRIHRVVCDVCERDCERVAVTRVLCRGCPALAENGESSR